MIYAMSALGQKQTFAVQQVMSALPLLATAKADVCGANRQVCFGPTADISESLFNHFVGGDDQRRWKADANRFRRPCVDQ